MSFILTDEERAELGLAPVQETLKQRIKRELGEDRAKLQKSLDQCPCGCYACNEEVQPGHFACEVPYAATLEMERAGEAVRCYDNGRWGWELV